MTDNDHTECFHKVQTERIQVIPEGHGEHTPRSEYAQLERTTSVCCHCGSKRVEDKPASPHSSTVTWPAGVRPSNPFTPPPFAPDIPWKPLRHGAYPDFTMT